MVKARTPIKLEGLFPESPYRAGDIETRGDRYSRLARQAANVAAQNAITNPRPRRGRPTPTPPPAHVVLAENPLPVAAPDSGDFDGPGGANQDYEGITEAGMRKIAAVVGPDTPLGRMFAERGLVPGADGVGRGVDPKRPDAA